MTDEIFVGVDGGASTIRVAAINIEGEVIKELSRPVGANYRVDGLVLVQQRLEEAVAALFNLPEIAVASSRGVVFGLAGCHFASDTAHVQTVLRQSYILKDRGRVTVLADSRLGLRSGTDDGCGLVLISGTGSACFGRKMTDQEALAGGVDYILSDEGSGYDIGLRALRAVTQGCDGRGGETVLQQVIFGHLGVHTFEQFAASVQEHYIHKPDIAFLASLVVQAAQNEDIVACDILIHAANDLVQMVEAVLDKLSWRNEPVKIVQMGSVLEHSQFLRSRVVEELKHKAPLARLVHPSMSPAVAGAFLAQSLDVPQT